GLADALFIYIHEFQLLTICRLLVRLVKTRRGLAATNDEERSADATRDDVLSNPPAISQRQRQKNREAQQEHAAARLHRLIKGRGGINQHRAHYGRRRNRKNVLGRITKGQFLDCPIIPANKVQRRHNHTELNKVDDEELKRH